MTLIWLGMVFFVVSTRRYYIEDECVRCVEVAMWLALALGSVRS